MSDTTPLRKPITRPGAGATPPADIEEVEVPEALPELLMDRGNLPAAVYEIRDLLVADAKLFDRGDILTVVQNDAAGELITRELRPSMIVMKVHKVCQPVQRNKKGIIERVTLTDRVAKMYLEMGEWGVERLAGITSAPLLRADGTIITARGYDGPSQMYCRHVPVVAVPDRPTKDQARAALGELRKTFCTFPFADSVLIGDDDLKVVDLNQPPGYAESGYLNALLTGVARASLWLAPGTLIIAPAYNGSGAGKGLLARAITIVAYGIMPTAFVAGDAQEFEKRISGALMTGRPVAMVDNINARMLKSETLASALTERPSQVRVFGTLNMHTLNAVASIVLTGNGLRVTEDLTRRLLVVYIDPRMENPETRPFPEGFLNEITRRRIELLEYALTILRWGRQNASQLQRGRPLGSFEQWAEWVRDPLLTLGCSDPVEEMQRAKQRDPKRQELAEIFTKWEEKNGLGWITAAELHDDVKALIDPTNRGRQFIASEVEGYTDTRIAGYVVIRRKNPGNWTTAIYRLAKTGEAPTEPADADTALKSPYWAHREAEAAQWKEQWQSGDNDDDPR